MALMFGEYKVGKIEVDTIVTQGHIHDPYKREPLAYVYKAWNTIYNRAYIGLRYKNVVHAELDIGKRYFTSSPEVSKLIRENPEIWQYDWIEFNDPYWATEAEGLLLKHIKNKYRKKDERQSKFYNTSFSPHCIPDYAQRDMASQRMTNFNNNPAFVQARILGRRTAESRGKSANAMKERWKDPAFREKMAEANRLRWERYRQNKEDNDVPF